MNDPPHTSNEGPIATRTRNTRFLRPPTQSAWCTRQCTTKGRFSSSSSEESARTETEFPYFAPGPGMDDDPAQIPPALVQLLEAMTARVTAHEQQLAAAPPRASGVQPPVFRGSPSEDIDEWLESFERYALFNRWTEDQQRIGLMMFLGGNAKRFCQRQPDDVRADFDQLQEALRDGFTSPHQTFLRRQELNMRKQGSHEPLEAYIEDIDARAQRLQLSDLETMQCFMQGLRQHLKCI